MSAQIAEITEVVETVGDETFLTLMGTFKVVLDKEMEVGEKRKDGKSVFVSSYDYENIRKLGPIDIIRAIKVLKDV